MVFSVVPYEDGTLVHSLGVGSLLSNFFFSSDMVQFVGTDDCLGCSREVIDIIKLYFGGIKIVVL